MAGAVTPKPARAFSSVDTEFRKGVTFEINPAIFSFSFDFRFRFFLSAHFLHFLTRADKDDIVVCRQRHRTKRLEMKMWAVPIGGGGMETTPPPSS